MDVVINIKHGGFSISRECAEWMAAKGHERAAEMLKEADAEDPEGPAMRLCGGFFGRIVDFIEDGDYSHRADPILVAAVRELGERAGGRFAKLGIATIPDGIAWTVEEYDGWETVVEKHRSWGAND